MRRDGRALEEEAKLPENLSKGVKSYEELKHAA